MNRVTFFNLFLIGLIFIICFLIKSKVNIINKLLVLLIYFLIFFIIVLPCYHWSGKDIISYRLITGIKDHYIKEFHKSGMYKLNKITCYENLEIINNVFSEAKIPFWLSEGTALGFKRDNDFIDWDDDVDIATNYKYKDEVFKLLPILINKGFEISKIDTDKGLFIVILRKNEKVDIDFIDNGVYCTTWKYGSELCDPIVPYVQDLDNIVIKDKIYKIPKDPYLIKLYGNDWKTPLKRDKGVANGL